MGLLDYFRKKGLSASPDVLETLQAGQLNPYPVIGGTNLTNRRINSVYVQAQSASYAYIYRSQPSVRTVVDFLARNVAQLGMKLYERVSDTERRQAGDHPAAVSMRNPNPQTPAEQFIFNLVADWCVYDNAYALKFRAGEKVTMVNVPAHAVGIVGQSSFTVDAYRIFRADGTSFDVDPEDIFHWRGYDPDDPRMGLSKLETLRQILAEDAASQTANVELLKSGLGQPGHIERPLDAPEWSEEARKRFEEDWANRAKNSGRKHPVLEEGMEFKPASVTPREAQMLEGRKLTLATVAGVYGIPLGLVGLETSTFREEERKQFYADVLPPITEMLAAYFDLQLLQMEYEADDFYFEFNLDEKLQGDDRLKALVSATGGPVMTRNEGRAKLNLPALDGGDELVTPLNVTVGGKPSPREMPIQDPNGPSQEGDERKALPRTKALLAPRRAAAERRRDGYAKDYEDVLTEFLSRQERTLKSRQMDAKAVDDERWDRELAADLLKVARGVVGREGGIAAARLGLADIDVDRTIAYLSSLTGRRAREINQAIRDALADGTPADVFREARDVAAPRAGLTLATSTAAFAVREAGEQSPDAQRRMKTWVVTSGNSSHPEMDGETVPLGTLFSNGQDGPPADHPGCACLLEIG